MLDIVIDETNMDKETRRWYILHCKLRGYKIKAVVLPKVHKNQSVARRLSSNHGNTPKAVWEEVWERKNEMYEEPTKEEGFDTVIYLK